MAVKQKADSLERITKLTNIQLDGLREKEKEKKKHKLSKP